MQKKSCAANKIWEAPTLHEMQGECDICAQECFPDSQLCVSLACGYSQCSSVIYHQACLEKYLKKTGLEGNRKTGFPCPRGRGKCTKFDEPCKGKIERSHPIINRNPAKQAKKAVPVEVIQSLGRGKPQPAAKPQPEAVKKPEKKRPALVMGPRIPNTMPGPSSAGVQPSAWRPSHGTRICPAPRTTPIPEDDVSVYSEATDLSAEHQDTQQDTGGGLIPGMDALLTKAQKKNLARRAKKQATQDGHAANSTADRAELSAAASLGNADIGRLDSPGGGHGSSADSTEWPPAADGDAGDTPREANPLVTGTGSWVTDPDAYSRLIASMGGASDNEEEFEELSHVSNPTAAADAGAVVVPQQEVVAVAVEQPAQVAVEPDAAAIARENEAVEAAIKASLEEAAARAAADAEAEAAAMQVYQQQVLERQQKQQQVPLQAHFAVPVPQPVAVHVLNMPVPTPLPVLPAYTDGGYGFATKQQPYTANGYASGHANGFATKEQLYPANGYANGHANGYAPGNAYGMGGYGAVEEQQGAGSDDEDFDSLLALCGVGA